MSGQAPPWERLADDDLEWDGRGTVPIVARAGDVALFVSDVWHRRLPRPRVTLVECSSSAITDDATWHNAFARRLRSTTCQ